VEEVRGDIGRALLAGDYTTPAAMLEGTSSAASWLLSSPSFREEPRGEAPSAGRTREERPCDRKAFRLQAHGLPRQRLPRRILLCGDIGDVANMAHVTEEVIMPQRNVYLHMPDHVHHRARVLAANQRRTVNDVYVQALQAYLEREERRAVARAARPSKDTEGA